MKDLGPAAGQAAQPGLPELGQQLARRPAGQAVEPVPLDGGVGFEVQPRDRLRE